MQWFIARENIDHYLGILNSDVSLAPEKRVVIIKLLTAELDKLSRDPEQLEFAETRAASCRERLKHVGARPADTEADRANAARLVADLKVTQDLLKDFCHRLRTEVSCRG
jgi:hypothetical protein